MPSYETEPASVPDRESEEGGASAPDGWMALLVILWGLNFAAVKGALAEIDPLALGAVRFAGATAVLVLAARVMGARWRVERADVPAAIGLGLVGHTAYQIFFALGLARTSTSHASLILALVPVAVALLGWVLGVERPSRSTWTGVALSVTGLALVVLGGWRDGGSSPLGDLLMIGAMLSWSVYTVASRPMLGRTTPMAVTTATMIVGTVGLLVVGAPAVLAQDWPAVSRPAWAMLAYSALGGLAVAYVIWLVGVQRLGAARTAVYANLVPLVALAVGWAVLGERLSAAQWVGALAAVSGVWIARRRP